MSWEVKINIVVSFLSLQVRDLQKIPQFKVVYQGQLASFMNYEKSWETVVKLVFLCHINVERKLVQD